MCNNSRVQRDQHPMRVKLLTCTLYCRTGDSLGHEIARALRLDQHFLRMSELNPTNCGRCPIGMSRSEASWAQRLVQRMYQCIVALKQGVPLGRKAVGMFSFNSCRKCVLWSLVKPPGSCCDRKTSGLQVLTKQWAKFMPRNSDKPDEVSIQN